MTSMPGASDALIEERKIADYLLSATHPVGRTKAEFFQRFGFRLGNWQELEAALLEHARTGEVRARIETPFGTKYIVEGRLAAVDGRRPNLRSVWFVETGQTQPRLVTALPMPEDA